MGFFDSTYIPVTITASQIAAISGYYLCNANATSIVLTLPTTPARGSQVFIQRLEASTNTVFYAPGGSDTIEGLTGSQPLLNADQIELTWNGTQWTMRRFTSSPTNATTMRRDAGGRSQVSTPVATGDIANKAYVDLLANDAYTPLSGDYTMPSNVVSIAAATPVSGVVSWSPTDIGSSSTNGWTPQSIAVNLSTLQVGGTGTLVQIGLYADRGDGGGPLISTGGRLAAGTINCLAAGGAVGIRTFTYTTPLTPGRYWVAFVYYQGTVAPTTVPQFTAITAATSLYAPVGNAFNVTRYLKQTGQTALPTGGGVVVSGTDGLAPLVSLRRA